VVEANQIQLDSATEDLNSSDKLTVCFFGGFRLVLDDAPVIKLPTGHSGMILKYLVYLIRATSP